MAAVALKYCGGCNPRYDRVKFVRDLGESVRGLEFSAAPQAADFALVVCGCPAKCVSHEHITGLRGKFVADSPDDREAVENALRKL